MWLLYILLLNFISSVDGHNGIEDSDDEDPFNYFQYDDQDFDVSNDFNQVYHG